jgi:FKBP-type peptidyl-prolyl cis-trans isomerase
MKYGIELLNDQPGDGPAVERHRSYRIRVKMWLNRGDPVRWERPWGLLTQAYLEDDGATLIPDVRMDRVFLPPGLFYGMEGMRIGGTRRLRIPPSFAFGEMGVPDHIPPNAVITAEVTVLANRSDPSAGDVSQTGRPPV